MTVGIFETDNGTKKRTIEELTEIRDSLEESVRAELDAIMQSVLATAIDLCPKDTGALASSISLENGVISSGDFYGCSIYAGSEDIINPKTGKPTSEYALMVHDGHVMPNGEFWEGMPFLDMAFAQYEGELQACVDKALSEMGANTPTQG